MALIIPEVYANLVTQEFSGKVKVLNLAVDAGNIPDFAQQGNEITFPTWVLASEDTTDMTTTGTEVVPEALGQVSTSAPVKFESKAIRVYDYDDKTALGNAINEATRQHGLVFARKLDADLIAEAKETTHVSACASATEITESELQTAMIEAFGDELDVEDMAGIIVNSRLVPSFFDKTKVASFTDMSNTTSRDDNGIIRNGLLGMFRGIPVYVSDKGTYNTTTSECESLIVKKGALAYKMKRGFKPEEERNAKAQATDIVASMMYAVKLAKADGVVLIKKTVA